MMHALAAFAGASHCDDVQPDVDQPSQVHRRRQLTLQEGIIQITGHPIEVSHALSDIQLRAQQTCHCFEHRVDQLLVHTRAEVEGVAATIEQRLQPRLEESFRSSQLVVQSSIGQGIDEITARADTAETRLIEARARLEEAVDINVANSQLIDPDNLIARVCEEHVNQALYVAQASFDAAVEAKAGYHASRLESRLREHVDESQLKTLYTAVDLASEQEARTQEKLESLLMTACKHTDSSVAAMETNLSKKMDDFTSKLDHFVEKKWLRAQKLLSSSLIFVLKQPAASFSGKSSRT
ncbi:hypothetical protein PHYSODRAFT_303424 [Phytophthora sojae]|uniref:Uncharacterized protein n=1 Tax=Phytophthora sojae (strain P6497) TaxID=1094619 RepID=G4ZRY6_PHYSP|nr:hypothetical protein PHYSODRAFT_303424 [Phytophthora sojae]EGZ14165.1 hypothetical protein PHYSODRAFT_303424 [Phytophthora sojae]|eukprot:XP_009531594.1 hypothetical protein PHYSODRAFT_303424 [Phytophthora sojae]